MAASIPLQVSRISSSERMLRLASGLIGPPKAALSSTLIQQRRPGMVIQVCHQSKSHSCARLLHLFRSYKHKVVVAHAGAADGHYFQEEADWMHKPPGQGRLYATEPGTWKLQLDRNTSCNDFEGTGDLKLNVPMNFRSFSGLDSAEVTMQGRVYSLSSFNCINFTDNLTTT